MQGIRGPVNGFFGFSHTYIQRTFPCLHTEGTKPHFQFGKGRCRKYACVGFVGTTLSAYLNRSFIFCQSCTDVQVSKSCASYTRALAAPIQKVLLDVIASPEGTGTKIRSTRPKRYERLLNQNSSFSWYLDPSRDSAGYYKTHRR